MALPAALRVRPRRLPLLALLAGNAISLVGGGLTAVALPWFVLQTTGSAARTGLVAAAAVLPAFAAGVFGGALVDRLGYKRVAVAADLVGAAGIALIPLLAATVGLAFWHLVALVFLSELLLIPGLSARRSLLPELAAAAGWRPERATAAFEASQPLALLLGPPLAGLLVVALGAAEVLWLDAATFAVSAALVAAAVPAASSLGSAAAGRYRDEIVAGIRFIRGDRLLLVLALTLTASNGLFAPMFAVLLPVYADDSGGGAPALGWILAAFGLGSFVGALAFGAVGHRLARRPVWLAAFLLGPAALWLLAASPPLPLLIVAVAAIAAVGGPINPLLVTVRHERIPSALRGRVFATFSAVAMLAQPAGLLLGGLLIDAVGFRPTVLLLAGGGQLLGVALCFVPTLREMDATKPRPTAAMAGESW